LIAYANARDSGRFHFGIYRRNLSRHVDVLAAAAVRLLLLLGLLRLLLLLALLLGLLRLLVLPGRRRRGIVRDI
jgi:hypothetical protein